MDTKTFAIIGGDKRSIVLSKMLSRQGHAVRVFGFAAVIIGTKPARDFLRTLYMPT